MAQHDSVSVLFVAGPSTVLEKVEVGVRGRTLETAHKTIDKIRWFVITEKTGKGGTVTRRFMCRSDQILSIADTRQAPPEPAKKPTPGQLKLIPADQEPQDA